MLCAASVVSVLWLGCADESTERLVAQGCSLSSECQSPLVCAFAKCSRACKASRDCAAGERCVQTEKASYICQKQGCARDSDCFGKQVCASDAKCHDECMTAKDCLADQVCSVGACADASELVNGALPNVLPKEGTAQRCAFSTDCAGDFVCLHGGLCGPECVEDRDCLTTETCRPLRAGGPGRCIPPPSAVFDGGGGG